jgi:hypothetical protein
MTGLSRCGKPYRTLESAVLAGELRTSKGARPLAVVSCALGDHWHLVPPASVTGHGYASPDPFPPAVRSMLVKRDECCQRCGYPGRLEAHHRRAKASGGSSARAHTQCACNGVMLCRRCHEWAHLHPRKARAAGWIVLQSTARPSTVSVRRSGIEGWPTTYPTCEGGWSDGT